MRNIMLQTMGLGSLLNDLSLLRSLAPVPIRRGHRLRKSKRPIVHNIGREGKQFWLKGVRP
jgi:hypothetical protein